MKKMRKGGKETRKADEEEEEEPSLMRPLKRLAANVLDRAVDKVETAMGIDGDEDAPPVMEQLRRMGTGLVEFQKTPEGKKATQELTEALSAQVEVLKEPLEKTADVVNHLADKEKDQAEKLGRDVLVDVGGQLAAIPLTVLDVIGTAQHAASAENKVSAIMDDEADPVAKAYNRLRGSAVALRSAVMRYMDDASKSLEKKGKKEDKEEKGDKKDTAEGDKKDEEGDKKEEVKKKDDDDKKKDDDDKKDEEGAKEDGEGAKEDEAKEDEEKDEAKDATADVKGDLKEGKDKESSSHKTRRALRGGARHQFSRQRRVTRRRHADIAESLLVFRAPHVVL